MLELELADSALVVVKGIKWRFAGEVGG